jgi:hypothetical protein
MISILTSVGSVSWVHPPSYRVDRSPILDGLSPSSIFLENRPEFRCILLTAWKIDGLALLWPESIYLIDPPELKPIGFVWVGCPPNRKSHVALGRRPEVPNLESQFLWGLHLVGPGYCETLIERSYTAISFVFRHIPAFVFRGSPPFSPYLATASRVCRRLLPSQRVSRSRFWLLAPASWFG